MTAALKRMYTDPANDKTCWRSLSRQEKIARFWARVHKTDGCWLWTGAVNQWGYGELSWGKTKVRAHRIAYELTTGNAPPEGKFLCHSCDVPRCVNPSHMFLGTPADNMQDAARKGRLKRPESAIRRGTQQLNAKLTDDDVREIRTLSAAGIMIKEIARRYSVSEVVISRIIRRLRWTHVA